MIDNNDKKDKKREIDDFFMQFDKLSDGLTKSTVPGRDKPETHANGYSHDTTGTASDSHLAGIQTTRSARHADKKKNNTTNFVSNMLNGISDWFKNKFTDKYDDDLAELDMGNSPKKRKKKKYKLNFKKIAKLIIVLGLLFCVAIGIYAGLIISKSPAIDPDNIYSFLSESSVLYDTEGNIIATVGSSQETRTIIEYEDLPKNLVNAFIAIEDKTFWEHKGFNIVRIFGAIKDSLISGRKIGGTSTITQQLARNVFLTDRMSDRSLDRKIAEAYYSIQIEKELSKKQIIEAYLNTINLGFGSHGVQAAAQAYFSKDVEELDLIECAALAALPKSPSTFALIKKYEPKDVVPERDVIIYEGSDYTYIYNGNMSENRRLQTLYNMCEQGLITEAEKDAAKQEDLLTHINPNMSSITEISSYFADYTVEQVINDLAKENRIEYADAKTMVYQGGLQIYTTLDTNIQKIVEQEYSDISNFPKVAGIKKDGNGNILNPASGKILLYSMDTYFDESGLFHFQNDELEWQPNGDLKLLKGKRLNFYKTVVNGQEDISIEFKNLYTVEDDIFYSIGGGNIIIPQEYKTRDQDGNAIISASYFNTDQKTILTADGTSYYVDKKHYSLKQKVIQPQSAMVITDYRTGQIKSMVGGRHTIGKLLFNRATSPRQPGSSIKPVCVYGAALQQSLDLLNGGTTPVYATSDNNGNPVENMYGTFLTAASVIDDAPLIVNGKQWPKNWYPGFRGLYTFRTAVEQSVNVCAVKVFEQVGVEYAVNFAKKLGITSIVEEGATNDMNTAALALGGMTNGASPLEMASAYGTYANQGTYVSPIAYTKVTNKRGETILENIPRSEKVVDSGVSFIMTDILRTTVSSGIAGRAAIGVQPVAGKTGTTTDNYDAWFVGFTPQYTAAVWIGNDVNIELSEGSAASAKLWSKVMKQALENTPAGTFASAPENVISVTIDTKSGLIPTTISSYDDRSTVRSEYFIRGTQPTASDNIHTYVTVCAETGYLATPYCTQRESKYGVKRPYLVSPEVADINYEVPHYYCNWHNPNTNIYPTFDSGLDPTASEQPGDSQITDPSQNPGSDSWITNPEDPSQGSEPSGTGDPGTSDQGGEPGYVEPRDDGMPEWLRTN